MLIVEFPGFDACRCLCDRRLLSVRFWPWAVCESLIHTEQDSTHGNSVGIVSCIRLASLYNLMNTTDLTCKPDYSTRSLCLTGCRGHNGRADVVYDRAEPRYWPGLRHGNAPVCAAIFPSSAGTLIEFI